MSKPASTPSRALHLVLAGFPAGRLDDIARSADPQTATEIFPLTETNAKEALRKIFAADTIAVWTKLG